MKRSLPSGFTLIELTVVLVIAGLLFAISVPNFSKLSDTRDYREAVREVVSAANMPRMASTTSSSTNVKPSARFLRSTLFFTPSSPCLLLSLNQH